MRMSVSGGFSQLNLRLARLVIHSGAKRRTRSFFCCVPSMKEIEMTSPDCHLLFLTRTAFVAPVVGIGAWCHAKHHLSWLSAMSSSLWIVFHSFLLTKMLLQTAPADQAKRRPPNGPDRVIGKPLHRLDLHHARHGLERAGALGRDLEAAGQAHLDFGRALLEDEDHAHFAVALGFEAPRDPVDRRIGAQEHAQALGE